MRKLGIHVAHWQRRGLFELVLQQIRTVEQTCEGWTFEIGISGPGLEADTGLADKYGARYVVAPNEPLGNKCNQAVQLLKDCDVLCGLGSDDLMCGRTTRALLEAVETYDMAGVLDIYLYDLPRRELYYWGGYPQGHRHGETVGPGRMVRRWLMDAIDWEPFGPELQRNLDRSMFEKIASLDYSRAVVRCMDYECMLVDVKTTTNINTMDMIIANSARNLSVVENANQLLFSNFGTDMMRGLWEL